MLHGAFKGKLTSETVVYTDTYHISFKNKQWRKIKTNRYCVN